MLSIFNHLKARLTSFGNSVGFQQLSSSFAKQTGSKQELGIEDLNIALTEN
jgi:hypothetical protein